MPGVMGVFRQFGKVVQMPVEHLADGSIHVYGRTPLALSEIVVSDLTSLYPKMQFRYTDIQTGEVSTYRTKGYQADMAFFLSTSVKGFENFTIRDVMELEPISVFKRYLLQVENRPQVVLRATRIQEEMLIEMNRVMLGYAKGHFSMSVAQQRSQKYAQSKADEMRHLLGNKKFGRLREIMLSSSLTASALQELLNK